MKRNWSSLPFHKLLIKLHVKIIKILLVQLLLYLFHGLPKPLEMDDLPGPQKLKGSPYLPVVNNADQVRAFCSAARSSIKSVIASPLD